ncbi:acyl-CoA reductase [Arenibacter sp. 6A1]|uniref:acyl-CoA reductase n=1 Tax=Arenibacter sp. 6A1 TaxID=2720391 RepID=UPI0014461AB0|nr:acyl-CoA reductase [Arenibacter sp. 6A1]NKI25043.1 acyl-CoA reductase [Arenibacter sp. 6A1]
MTDLTHISNSFVKLGSFFHEYYEYSKNNAEINSNQQLWFQKFDEAITLSGHKNGWFTKENILYSLKSWAEQLTAENLEEWLSAYEIEKNQPKTVAIIMAGNIPLVGFHDFLSTLITGNRVLIKLSSNDTVLLPCVAQYLIELEPSLREKIDFADGKLDSFDAVIATGSNNTSRYFEHYFSKKPNLIRKSRNSVAVLTNKETKEQLTALGEDIFRYYGLGCRSISKIFVPRNYNFDQLYEAIYSYKDILDQAKFSNNYDYNKAVYLMSEYKILDNGFLMLKEDANYASPIATLFYEYYDSLEELKNTLSAHSERLQCIVADGVLKEEVKFGHTQKPSLKDYADNIDTVDFLIKT